MNPAWCYLRPLRKGQDQNPLLHLGADALLVNVLGQLERPVKGPGCATDCNWLSVLFPGLCLYLLLGGNGEDAMLNLELDVLFAESREVGRNRVCSGVLFNIDVEGAVAHTAPKRPVKEAAEAEQR